MPTFLPLGSLLRMFTAAMISRIRRVRRDVALLLLASCNALAAPFAVQLGDTRLALDSPPGFADVQATGSPRLLEHGEALTSASNRILLFALEDADLRRFTVGDDPLLRRYVLVATPKGLEHERVTQAAFNTLVKDSLRALGPLPLDGDPRGYIDAAPRGQAALLAELRKDAQVASVLQGARLPDPPEVRLPPRYLLSTTTLMLVRGKALNVSVYALYDSPADVQWIRATTSRWIEELQRLNNR
jgi:hypothetical protein